jgi:bifunctional UDP-N-acetylglucosamine pyrophosphorylase/glucosamine-1-phosphate N-acetyltransferase
VEIADFMAQCLSAKVSLGLIGFSPPNNYGYGRLVSKKQPWLDNIVEEKDASTREKRITLCNSGVIFAEVSTLFGLLNKVKPQNAQKEFYLTSIFDEAKKKKIKALIYEAKNYQSFQGINDRWQLSTMESYLVEQHIETLAKSGVSFHLPLTSFIDLSVQIGANTVIGSHVVLQQNTSIGEGCVVLERTTLKNVKVGQGAIIGANCYLAGCNIKDREEIPAGTIRTE